MAKKSGLGNILDSIFDDDIGFSDDAETMSKGVSTLKITEIEPNRDQPRKVFDSENLERLADSIAEHGVIQPLTVRPYGDGYQIVAGERRWRAARMAGLSEVPVRIMELSDVQTMQIALIENLQREDLNPIEEAMGYQELIERFDMKQEDVAKKVGKARSSVANSLRLLSLPEDVRVMVRGGELSKGHCKAIMACQDEKLMAELANKVIKEGVSVRALEKLIKNSQNKKSEKPVLEAQHSTFFKEAEISLRDAIGKPVKVVSVKNKITLEIELADEEELREIVNLLAEAGR